MPLPALAPEMEIMNAVTPTAAGEPEAEPGFGRTVSSMVIMPVAIAELPSSAPDQARS